MNLTNLIRTAWYSIRAYKFRIFLTMIGIIIGISSVSAILAIGEGLSEGAVKSLDSSNLNTITVYYDMSGSEDAANEQPFRESDMTEIRKMDGVEKVEKNVQESFMSMDYRTVKFFDKSQGSQMMEFSESGSYPLSAGKLLSKAEAESNQKKIILAYDIAEKLFQTPDKAIGKGVDIEGDMYEVVGVRESMGMPTGFNFSMDFGASLLPKKTHGELNKVKDSDAINLLSITLKPDADTKTTSEAIKEKLMEQHPNLTSKYTTSSSQEMIENIRSVFSGITTFVALVTGISLLVGGIGVMNIMYVSITERKREIGIRRAIGAKPATILMQFLVEAIFITGAGGIIGIIVGFIISKAVGSFMPFQPVMTMKNFLLASSISVFTGIIFGVIPAYKAAKLDPIKAIYQ